MIEHLGIIAHPHIPRNNVTLCAIGAGHPYIKRALEHMGICVLELAPENRLPAQVAAHGDMLLHPAGSNIVFTWGSDTTGECRVQQLGYTVRHTSAEPGNRYPLDVGLNCLVLGEFVFCMQKGIDPELLIHYQAQDKKIIHVAQGYTKCSVCIVDERSIITSDPSIAKAARQLELDVLCLQPGHILLPGYGYGFIGGCSGLLAPDILAFCGDIGSHVDHRSIIQFCVKRGVTPISLGTGPLRDIGGIIPLLE